MIRETLSPEELLMVADLEEVRSNDSYISKLLLCSVGYIFPNLSEVDMVTVPLLDTDLVSPTSYRTFDPFQAMLPVMEREDKSFHSPSGLVMSNSWIESMV